VQEAFLGSEKNPINLNLNHPSWGRNGRRQVLGYISDEGGRMTRNSWRRRWIIETDGEIKLTSLRR